MQKKTPGHLRFYLMSALTSVLILAAVSGCIDTVTMSAPGGPGGLQSSGLSSSGRYDAGLAGDGTALHLRAFIFRIAIGLLVAVILGLVMAVRFSPSAVLIWICLIAGLLVPLLIYLIRNGLP